MGEADKLQQPGDFISALITDRPYVACIDQTGELQAYHNVCCHHHFSHSKPAVQCILLVPTTICTNRCAMHGCVHAQCMHQG